MPRLLRALLRFIAVSSLSLACSKRTNAVAEEGPADTLEPDSSAPDGMAWRALFEDLEAPLLSAWGPSIERLFFVGEDGLIIQREGDDWMRWLAPSLDSLWWVWGKTPRDVYAGGEGGTLIHFDGVRWSPLEAGLDPEETVWGIWGDGRSVWLVGGRARTNGPGMILRGDEDGWTRLSQEGELPNLYKIWGRSSDEIYVVGDDSSLYRLTQEKLVEVELGASGDSPEPLFTVSGNASDTVFVVGGLLEALAFEQLGEGFASVGFVTSGLNGVSVSEAGNVVVVGRFGVIRERVDDRWFDRDLFVNRHYHAAITFDDGAYAVGGDLLASGERRRGLIVARGDVSQGNLEQLLPHVDIRTIDAGSANDGSVTETNVPDQDPSASKDAGSFTSPLPLLDAATGATTTRDAGLEPSNIDPTTRADAGRDAGGTNPTRPLGAEAGAESPNDAGQLPVKEAGTSLPGPGQLCSNDAQCAEGLECWYIEGQNEERCVAPCEDAGDCTTQFGDGSYCAPPGCQTTTLVCLRETWVGCFFY